MNSYVAGFIVFILVFSLAVVSNKSQTAAFGLDIEVAQEKEEKPEEKQNQQIESVSFGGAIPSGNPKANYEKYNPEDFRENLGLFILTQQQRSPKTVNRATLPSRTTTSLLWPVASRTITQDYGKRSSLLGGNVHEGIDISVTLGTAVTASANGFVSGTGDNGSYGYGRWVSVNHGNNLTTLYGHLSRINVRNGQSVVAGQLIGSSGSTGFSTGPHLHFGVYTTDTFEILSSNFGPVPVGGPINPFDYLASSQGQVLGASTQTPGGISQTPTSQIQSPVPESFIIEGPDRTRDFLLDEITFKFGGFVSGNQQATDDLRFETRLLGPNQGSEIWRGTFSKEITYKLNIKGSHQLVFEVRAKTKSGTVDPTPASWAFRLAHSQRYGEVQIGSVRPGFGSVDSEQISIRNTTNSNINITRWQIADSTSRSPRIGQGVEIIQPRSNLNFLSDIILPPRGSATIFSKTSPLGFSWRENKCTTHLSRNTFIDGNTNYENCYFEERTESNFLHDKWNVYLGLFSPILDDHSTLLLLDESGAVVDVQTY
ncbi:hypothetical protein C4553_00315 [Candidatus Parcubacteria bacterium]|nr:MAG: hypothetical protein C4553_00315 [Candidatus Parcubacteria bacterium]